ncbi:unnamed protein product [Ilex paraguariensis]|uniref:DOG1 domain-containing protein n=1 Tax=Ilex paraguariensis TaxID=185542 RepID=A0ABC8TWQ6_9AQUA
MEAITAHTTFSPLSKTIPSVSDLSEEQLGRMGQLIEETGIEEKELAEVVSRVQGNLATAMVAEAARSTVNGEASEVELAIERLRTTMKDGKTVMKIVKILRPAQTVRFLAAFAQFQLRIRIWGIHADKDGAT